MKPTKPFARHTVLGNRVFLNLKEDRTGPADNAGWRWEDTGEPTRPDLTGPIVYGNRVCPECKLPPSPEGHDPCIANLPGVEFACCGHGKTQGYVKFENGVVLRGVFDHRRGE